MAILLRAVISDPSNVAVRILEPINWMAFSAYASLIRLDFSETYASIACVNASIPVDAVMDNGIPACMVGSIMAYWGIKFSCVTDSLI